MLVREQGRDLHLLSAISPEWIGPGKRIAIRGAPTEFGELAYSLDQPDGATAVLHLDARFTVAPRHVIVHVPWFMHVTTLTVDGKPARVEADAIRVAPTARELRLRWKKRAPAPNASYQQAVDDYKTEYARRFEERMHGPP
jgi:hypothetical protein